MPVCALTKWRPSVTLVTGFLLLHLLKHSVIFISASSCTALKCQSVFPGLCKDIKSIKQGGIVPKIFAKTSFPLLHGSVQSVSLPLARGGYSLYTHNTKTPSSWLGYPMGSLNQIKQIGFLLTEYHRFLIESSTVLQNQEWEDIWMRPLGVQRAHLYHQILFLGTFGFKRTSDTKMLFLLSENTPFVKTKWNILWLQGVIPQHPSELLWSWADVQSGAEERGWPCCRKGIVWSIPHPIYFF